MIDRKRLFIRRFLGKAPVDTDGLSVWAKAEAEALYLHGLEVNVVKEAIAEIIEEIF